MSVRVQDVIDALEDFAPLPLQESYDNAGLQVGLTGAEVSGALLCLDVTEEVIAEALELGCNMIVSHHPLIFRGLKHLTDEDTVQRCVRMALRNDIAIYFVWWFVFGIDRICVWSHIGIDKTTYAQSWFRMILDGEENEKGKTHKETLSCRDYWRQWRTYFSGRIYF